VEERMWLRRKEGKEGVRRSWETLAVDPENNFGPGIKGALNQSLGLAWEDASRGR